MPSVAVLTIEGCYASCAAGYVDVLQAANAHLRASVGTGQAPFAWRFVSGMGGAIAASNGMVIETTPLDDTCFDLIVIPAIHYPGYAPYARLLDGLGNAYDWLRPQWDAGAWIGTHCSSVFILAQSGLLDGRVATTTWWLDRRFRSRYPKVDLQYRSALTEVDRLLCAGAMATYLPQAVRFVDVFMGRAIASQAAKSLMIDTSETGQIPYLPILTETRHNDFVVERAQQWLRKHMARDVAITELAQALAVSERTLARKFNAAIGQTPLGYLQTLRLSSARALLEAGDLSVEAIANQVGYADASSFSRLFRHEIGISPGAYRQRFRHDIRA